MNPERVLDNAVKAARATQLDEPHHPDLAPDKFTVSERPVEGSAYAPGDFNQPPPWTRMKGKGESTAQHDVFRHFLSLGPHRKLVQVAEDRKVSAGTVGKWAKRFDWMSRAAAWDSYVDEQYEEEIKTRLKETADRHAKQIGVALEGLAKALEPIGDPEFADELRELPAKVRMNLAIQAARAMPALAMAERMALGAETESSRIEPEAPVVVLSLDDMKKIFETLNDAGITEKQSSFVEAEVIDVEGEEI